MAAGRQRAGHSALDPDDGDPKVHLATVLGGFLELAHDGEERGNVTRDEPLEGRDGRAPFRDRLLSERSQQALLTLEREEQ